MQLKQLFLHDEKFPNYFLKCSGGHYHYLINNKMLKTLAVCLLLSILICSTKAESPIENSATPLSNQNPQFQQQQYRALQSKVKFLQQRIVNHVYIELAMALVIIFLLCRTLVLSNTVTVHQKLTSSREEMQSETEKI